MYFDSHVHFEKLDGQDGLIAVVKRARDAGVDKMLAVGGSPDMNRFAIEAAERFPGAVYAAIGCDRDHLECECDPLFFEKHISARNVVAVGEIGLDFHYHPEKPSAQFETFEKMLEVARAYNLPSVIHSRDAEDETLDALRRHAGMWKGDPGRIGVLHCFTAGRDFALELIKLGYYIGLSGIVTFRNADTLRELACHLPEDRILVETDTPYLAPVPHRGKRNEPSYLPAIVDCIANQKGVEPEVFASLTKSNASRLFGI